MASINVFLLANVNMDSTIQETTSALNALTTVFSADPSLVTANNVLPALRLISTQRHASQDQKDFSTRATTQEDEA